MAKKKNDKTPPATRSEKVKHPKPGIPHGQAKGPNSRPAKSRKSPPSRNKREH